MALGAALVDRARVVRRTATGKRVEGTTQMADVHGPWFKCRIFVPPSRVAESPGDSGRRKANQVPELLFALRDENGDPVEVALDDMLEVETSGGLPASGRWRIAQVPTSLRRKRSVLGWQAQVERVVEARREG